MENPVHVYRFVADILNRSSTDFPKGVDIYEALGSPPPAPPPVLSLTLNFMHNNIDNATPAHAYHAYNG